MSDLKKEKYRELIDRYKSKIEHELSGEDISDNIQLTQTTRDYKDFRKEIVPPHFSLYEKACLMAGKILNIKPDPKKAKILNESIASAHLSITPTGSASLGILIPLFIILFGGMLAFAIFQSMTFVLFILILAAVLIKPLSNLPIYMANYWRLKASNQMVLCIFYVVTYMRHTSNIENAIQFASEHLAPPLSLDLKKIIWDVETEKFESLKESLDAYLDTWRKYNMEFVEAFHLIESSLLEADESRRLGALDKSLEVILDETYEKMLHYAHNLKAPITMLHMLGVILPILGLVVLPLVVSFMDDITWLHLMFFYNLVIPVAVYSIGRAILTKRPTGYGDSDISEEHPELKKYKYITFRLGKTEYKISPLFIAGIVAAVLFIIGISPIVLHSINPLFDMPIDPDGNFMFLGYEKNDTGDIIGPYGIGASILSLFITMAAGLGFGLYFALRSKNIIKIRKKTKQLEDEFASALFQLGNRLDDGIPAEMAFSRVAGYMPNTKAGKFFQLVSINVQKLGMSVAQAIFNPKYGAILHFPSKIIESSMKVLIESIKKGPKVAAQALTNIARYIKEIHRVNERLKDLMADIISSMSSQIKFLTPAISGIVVGITSMITTILSRLTSQVGEITASQSGAQGVSAPMDIAEMFGMGIPTFYFQIVVGIYVVEIIYILTILANGIENGSDKLNERYALGTNLIKSTLLYCFIAGFVMILFNMIASSIIGSSLTTI